MNVLITGAAGFIGSHLSEALLRQGHRVIGVDNFNDFYSPQLKRQNLSDIQQAAKKAKSFFQCYSGDICDRDLLDSLFLEQKIEIVVHLAAMAGVRPSIKNPLLYEKVNGLGTVTLLEAMKQAGVRDLIFGSSSSVYGLNKKVPFSEEDPVDLPFSPYAATKRAGELTCRVYHQLCRMNVAILRFFTVYGARQRPDLAIRKFTDLIFRDQPIDIYGDGSNRRDFTYIDDIIDGVVKSIDWVRRSPSPRPSPIKGEGGGVYEIFNLGESQTTTVLDLISLLEKSIGKKAEKKFLPAEPGDVRITYADITKSKKILGYNPKTSLEAGIPLFVEWYQKSILSKT